MNKLSRKLFLRIGIVVIIIFLISFLCNNYFLSKYYLHQKNVNLSNVAKKIESMEVNSVINNIESIEQEYNVTIVYENLSANLDGLNGSIKNKLNKKSIILNKFWVTPEGLDKIKQGKRINLIYNQGKLKSSFLVTVIKKENILIVAGISIAHDSETINIVNQFNLFFIFLDLLFILVVVWLFCKKIIYPLEKLKDMSKDIANLNFTKVEIHTNDEIEELSESINDMSEKLRKAHVDLEEKNENLKILISDISHELKTPSALIKAYCFGIRDKLDDGTYLDVIEKQADDISKLLDNLLHLSKYQNDIISKTNFDIEDLFFNTFEKYKISIENKGIFVSINKNDLKNKVVFEDKGKIEIVLNNLINNAIKYTEDNKVQINLKNVKDRVFFSIQNGISSYDPNVMEKIWEPFYVIESSRDKKVSGTGLGLSIVRAILQKHHIEYGFNLNENQIEFYIFFDSTTY